MRAFCLSSTQLFTRNLDSQPAITRSSYQVQTSQLAVILFQITPFKSEVEVAS